MSIDQTFEIIELKRKMSELETENEKLQANTSLAEAHKAMEPFIAGGSEYTGIGGLIRAIKEVGEAKRENWDIAKDRIIQRNELIRDFKSIQEYIEKGSWDSKVEDLEVTTDAGIDLLNVINPLLIQLMYLETIAGAED